MCISIAAAAKTGNDEVLQVLLMANDAPGRKLVFLAHNALLGYFLQVE
ncbi:hypothetical protein H6F96_24505 [Microcoleus sp. FACHB-53]|nr:hypothetical protein [Microcoleus sp. FACHB-53]